MLETQVSTLFLGLLSLMCIVYGVYNLVCAYRLSLYEEWLATAFLGASNLALGALFARYGYLEIGGFHGLSGVVSWFQR